MMQLEFIKNCLISNNDLEKIIEVKQKAWPYSIESQLLWIKSNLKPNDIHVLLKDASIILAYLNLVYVKVGINGKEISCIGVGNVCSYIKGKGYGGILLTMLYKYILANNLKCILFCKNELVSFYSKYNWKLIPSEKIVSTILNSSINTMTCNIDNIHELMYEDRLF